MTKNKTIECPQLLSDKLRALKYKSLKEVSFFEDAVVKIMAKLVGADKDICISKYTDGEVDTEEMEAHFLRLASVALWSAEALFRTLVDDRENVKA